jgi:hypothetical protein
MLKNILRLLAACISFVALLFVTNPAIATAQPATTEHQLQSPAVNLNVVSPSLQASNSDNPVNHVGCSCAVCTQSLQ